MANVSRFQQLARSAIQKKKVNVLIGFTWVGAAAVISFFHIPTAFTCLAVGLGWLMLLSLVIVSDLQNYSRSIWRSVFSYENDLKSLSSQVSEPSVPDQLLKKLVPPVDRGPVKVASGTSVKYVEARFHQLEKNFEDFLITTLSQSIKYERNGIPLSILKLNDLTFKGDAIGCVCLPAHSKSIRTQLSDRKLKELSFLPLDGKAHDLFPQTWSDLVFVLPGLDEKEAISRVDPRTFRWVPRDSQIFLLSDSDDSVEILSKTLRSAGMDLALKLEIPGVYRAAISFID